MARFLNFMRVFGWTLALGVLGVLGSLLLLTLPRPNTTATRTRPRTPDAVARRTSVPIDALASAHATAAPACADHPVVSSEVQVGATAPAGSTSVTVTVANPADRPSLAAELHIVTPTPVAVAPAPTAGALLQPVSRTRLAGSDELVFRIAPLPTQAHAALPLTLDGAGGGPGATDLIVWIVVHGMVCDERVLTVPGVAARGAPGVVPTAGADVVATAPVVATASVPLAAYSAPVVATAGVPLAAYPAPESAVTTTAPVPTPSSGATDATFTLTQESDRTNVQVGDAVHITLAITMQGWADVTVYVDNVLPPCLALTDLSVSRRDATYRVEYADQRVGMRVDGMADGETIMVHLVTHAVAATDDGGAGACVNTAHLAALGGAQEWTAAAAPLAVTIRPAP